MRRAFLRSVLTVGIAIDTLLLGGVAAANSQPTPAPATPAATAWTPPPEAEAAFPDHVAKLRELERTVGPEHPEVAKALRQWAQAFLDQGRPDLARPLVERALQIDERTLGPDNPELAKRLLALAVVVGHAGDPGGAIPVLERALAISEKALGPMHPQVAGVLTELGNDRSAMGDFAASRALHERALAIREKVFGPNDRTLARDLSSIGRLAAEEGDVTAARAAFERALRISEMAYGPVHVDVAGALNNLALLLTDVGDLATARSLYERAMAIEEKTVGTETVSYAYTIDNLAGLLESQGDLQAARSLHERAAHILEKAEGPEHLDVAHCLSNLANVLTELDKTAEATNLNQRSLALLEKALGPDHPDVAKTLLVGARLQLASGNPEKARAMAERAIALAEKAGGPDSQLLGAALDVQARILEAQGDAKGAVALLDRAIAGAARSFGPDHVDLVPDIDALALLRWRQGDEDAARAGIIQAAGIITANSNRVLPFLAFAEQRAFLDAYVQLETSLLLSTHRTGAGLQRAYALLFRWKGLLIDSLRRQTAVERLGRDPKTSGVASHLRELRTRIAGWYHEAGSVSVEDWRKEYAALTAEKEAAERELARTSSPDALADRLASLDLPGFAALLRAGEAFVDIYRYGFWRAGRFVEDRYAAVITGPGAAPALVDLGAAAPIDGAVRTWRADVFRGEHSEKSWQTIAATLWKPLVPALPKRTARVWLSPDGELARIPWHLLPTTDRATRHILVSQCDSAREVAALSSPQKGTGTARPVLFLAGGVDFDAGAAAPGVRRGGEFEKLPGTAGEIARLRALAEKGGFDVAVASGSDASKERVRMELQKAAFAHLATHGFFFQERPAPSSRGRDTEPDASARRTAGRNPLVESGIALAGANLRDATTQEAKGLLTAEELVGLDLSHCQLVTLSACDTGRGEEVTGQGVMGLRAACLAAGARSMVMSLWTVPDESTAKLMQAFYANLWEKKLPRVEALRRAQETVRDDPSGSFREPIHWAGWALAGEGW